MHSFADILFAIYVFKALLVSFLVVTYVFY